MRFVYIFDKKSPSEYNLSMRLSYKKTKFGNWLIEQINNQGLDWLGFADDLGYKERTFRRYLSGDSSLKWDLIIKSCTLLSTYTGKKPIEHVIDCVNVLSKEDADVSRN